MARITIEDCIEEVPNRFQLVQMTAIRAKQLKKGATALVQNDENKEVVVALREIAAGKVDADESAGAVLESEEVVEALADEAVVEAPPVEAEAGSTEAAEDGEPVAGAE